MPLVQAPVALDGQPRLPELGECEVGRDHRPGRAARCGPRRTAAPRHASWPRPQPLPPHPSGLSGTSCHPVKRFCWFHVLSPWRTMTSVPVIGSPTPEGSPTAEGRSRLSRSRCTPRSTCPMGGVLGEPALLVLADRESVAGIGARHRVEVLGVRSARRPVPGDRDHRTRRRTGRGAVGRPASARASCTVGRRLPRRLVAAEPAPGAVDELVGARGRGLGRPGDDSCRPTPSAGSCARIAPAVAARLTAGDDRAPEPQGSRANECAGSPTSRGIAARHVRTVPADEEVRPCRSWSAPSAVALAGGRAPGRWRCANGSPVFGTPVEELGRAEAGVRVHRRAVGTVDLEVHVGNARLGVAAVTHERDDLTGLHRGTERRCRRRSATRRRRARRRCPGCRC